MTSDNKYCNVCGQPLTEGQCANRECVKSNSLDNQGTVMPGSIGGLDDDFVLADDAKVDPSKTEFSGTIIADGESIVTDEKDNEIDRTLEAIFPLESMSKAPDGPVETTDSKEFMKSADVKQTLSIDEMRPQSFEGGIVPPLREIQFPSRNDGKAQSWSGAIEKWKTKSLTSFEADEYRVFNVLGEGGYGVVFEAEHKALGRSVAIKVLKPRKRRKGTGRPSGSGTGSGEFQKRQQQFLHEASVTAVLQHPNIMPVYDFGINPKGELFYSMKKVDNPRDWNELIESPAKLLGVSEQEANDEHGKVASIKANVEIFSKLCDAMAYTHSKGIIHRDLKPQNIMIGDYGEVLLIDFGMALDFSTGRKRFVAGGTPTYMAPEMAQHFITWGKINDVRGNTARLLGVEQGSIFLEQSNALGFGSVAQKVLDEADDPELQRLAKRLVELDAEEKAIAKKISFRSDIYLLGAILYEIAVGVPPHLYPFQSFLEQKPELKSDSIRAKRAFNNFLIRAAARNQNYGPKINNPLQISLRNIALKAMETNPADRYASVEQLQEAISDFNNQVQALELADKGRQDFARAKGRDDYQYLLPALESFRGAREIWTGATEASRLKNTVACEYGRRALERKDFDAGIDILDEYVDEEAKNHKKVVEVRKDLISGKNRAKRNRLIGTIATVVAGFAILASIPLTYFGITTLPTYLEFTENKEDFEEFNKPETRTAFDDFNKEEVRIAFREFNREDVQKSFNEFNKEETKLAFNEFNKEDVKKSVQPVQSTRNTTSVR